MSFAAAKAEILATLARIPDDWQDYELKIEIDNRTTVNQGTHPDPYLMAQIVNLNGEQLELGIDPTTKQRGQILLVACQREGSGTLEATRLLEFAARYFHAKDFEFVRCHVAEAVKGQNIKGWWHEPAIINFWYIWK